MHLDTLNRLKLSTRTFDIVAAGLGGVDEFVNNGLQKKKIRLVLNNFVDLYDSYNFLINLSVL